MTLYLEQIEPGKRFQIAGGGRIGTLVYCGPGTARVKWEGSERERSFVPQPKPGEAAKTVTVRSGPVEENIAPRTEVEAL
jgi:hypothetical protein